MLAKGIVLLVEMIAEVHQWGLCFAKTFLLELVYVFSGCYRGLCGQYFICIIVLLNIRGYLG